MGKSYTYTWEGQYQQPGENKFTGEKKEEGCHLVYGMSISEIIKKLINIYDGNVKQFTVTIFHQTRPGSYPVRQLKILKDFQYDASLHYIHDIYRGMGLDYNKPIPRKYYELKTIIW